MQQKIQPFFIVKMILILIVLGWITYFAKVQGIYIPISHLDGYFQTASGLYRLDSGQFPGKDFLPYLGIGPLFLIYPFFKILGANISASVVASQFVVLLLAWLFISILWQLLCKPRSFLTSLAIGGFFLLCFYQAILFLSPYFVSTEPTSPTDTGPYIWQIAQNIKAGSSLRAIRASLPTLVAFIYYLLILKIKKPSIKYLLSGFLAGATLLWSNDYAIPTSFLFVIFVFFIAYFRCELNAKNGIFFIITFILSWSALITLATQNHVFDLLSYNFRDVAYDQWWYFAPYTEVARLLHIGDIKKLFYLYCIPSYILVIVYTYLFFKRHAIEYALIAWIGLALFCGGALSCIGGHVSIFYFGAFIYWGFLVITILICRFLWNRALHLFTKEKDKSFTLACTMLLALAISSMMLVGQYNIYQGGLKVAQNKDKYFYVHELGGYLDNEWKGYVQLARESKSKKTIEEYWGIWSAITRTPSLWPVDSAIHALGKVREQAQLALSHADILISSNTNFYPLAISPKWQAWSYTANFWFYEEIMKNRNLVGISPTTFIWIKNNSAIEWPAIQCLIDSQTNTVTVQAPHSGHYAIQISYQLAGSGRTLLLFKSDVTNPVEGYVSINPTGKQATFPLYFEQAGQQQIQPKVLGREIFNLKILQCEANAIDFPMLNNKGEMTIPVQ